MTRKKRKKLSLEVRLAAALILVGKLSHETAKRMTNKQIIRLFVFHHHPIPHAQGGPDAAWNLVPMLKPDHDLVTRTVTVPQIAKTKRISAAHEDFRRRVLAPVKRPRRKRSRWPKRKFGT